VFKYEHIRITTAGGEAFGVILSPSENWQ